MKPSQVLLKRVARHALSTKKANKGFYKGTGTGSTGSHTIHGGYKIDWTKVRTYVCPKDLKDFNLTPFVTRAIQVEKGRFEGDPKGAFSGKAYLARWKSENGQD